jgi:co-chaperonin GroES (HSP10)
MIRTRSLSGASFFAAILLVLQLSSESTVHAFSSIPAADPERLAALGRNVGNKHRGGAGVGRLVVEADDEQLQKWKCHYDMVLVERIQGRPKLESGLFVPDEVLPKLLLCRVISVGPGEEAENGRILPMPNIQSGDVIIAKNPWGIGPKDEETLDGKKLSFMRARDIVAVVEGGLEPED